MEMPDEIRTTCADCPMAPPAGPSHSERPAFSAPARCCTYHPRLANFLVGRVLRRGDRGTRAMRRRIEAGQGLEPRGVVAPDAVYEEYGRRANDEYGCFEELTCPYWAPGTENCTIHVDRGAVCRTWHCRVEDGRLGNAAWQALRELLLVLEICVVELCLESVTAPESTADASEWIAYYIACSDAVDAAGQDHLGSLRDDRITAHLRALAEAIDALHPDLPDVLMASVGGWFSEGDQMFMSAHSSFDLTATPGWIFEFLSRLDGERPWSEAIAETESVLGHPIPEDLVPRMFRRGLLSSPTALDLDPHGVSIRLIPSPDE